jgi:GT2 family glycosyltransferase
MPLIGLPKISKYVSQSCSNYSQLETTRLLQKPSILSSKSIILILISSLRHQQQSSDESYTFLSSKYFKNPKVSIHNTGANLGFAQGNNFGLKLASQKKYQYYLLSNNDILVKPDFLEILLEQAKKLSEVGMLGPKIYFAPGYEYHHSRYTKSKLAKSSGLLVAV